jgi:hypothetical protein
VGWSPACRPPRLASRGWPEVNPKARAGRAYTHFTRRAVTALEAVNTLRQRNPALPSVDGTRVNFSCLLYRTMTTRHPTLPIGGCFWAAQSRVYCTPFSQPSANQIGPAQPQPSPHDPDRAVHARQHQRQELECGALVAFHRATGHSRVWWREQGRVYHARVCGRPTPGSVQLVRP